MTRATTRREPGQMDPNTDRRGAQAMGHETKPALKSTEFYIYLASVAAVLMASQVVGRIASGDQIDPFRADRAWWYITLLTIGYLISRGLAKAGSQSRHSEDRPR